MIGAAIEVHRLKGAGLLESIYEKCLYRELQLREVPAVAQMEVESITKATHSWNRLNWISTSTIVFSLS